MVFFAGEETPGTVEPVEDVPNRTNTETYEQKLERFYVAQKAIVKEINDTQDQKLKGELQEKYYAFLKESSQMLQDLQGLEVSREEIIELSLMRLARFTKSAGLGKQAEMERVSVDKIHIDPDMPRDIQKEISLQKVLENLAESPRFTAKSGRLYRMVGDKVYYNSKPNEKNTWGELSDNKPTFVEINGKFTEIKLLGPENSLPRVYETADGRFILDDQGTLTAPDANGVFKFPGKYPLFYIRIAGKLEECDAKGVLRAVYIENMLQGLNQAGFKAKYNDGFMGALDGREVSMDLSGGGSVRLFQLSIGKGKEGDFAIQCNAENETSYSSVEEVIEAAKQRKEKIDTLMKDMNKAAEATTNPEKYRAYGKLFGQLYEVRYSFSNRSTDKTLLAQFANQAAWAVVENHMNDNPQGLKLGDAAKYIRHLNESLADSYYPDPNQVDTVAQYYKLQFQKEGDKEDKEMAIDLLQKTIGKSRKKWDKVDAEDQQQVEKNEKLLQELRAL